MDGIVAVADLVQEHALRRVLEMAFEAGRKAPKVRFDCPAHSAMVSSCCAGAKVPADMKEAAQELHLRRLLYVTDGYMFLTEAGFHALRAAQHVLAIVG